MQQNEEYIMVVSASDLWRAGYFQGLCFDLPKYLDIIEEHNNIAFNPREEMEVNSDYKQIIPYVILFHNGAVFSYRRGKLLGEKRLLGNYSIGVGGHISAHDRNLFDCTYIEAMRRELKEEVEITSSYKEYSAALLNDDSNEVGRVHFGIVHLLCLDKPLVKPKEKSMNEAGFVEVATLLKNIEKYENWAQICIGNIERILAVCNK